MSATRFTEAMGPGSGFQRANRTGVFVGGGERARFAPPTHASLIGNPDYNQADVKRGPERRTDAENARLDAEAADFLSVFEGKHKSQPAKRGLLSLLPSVRVIGGRGSKRTPQAA